MTSSSRYNYFDFIGKGWCEVVSLSDMANASNEAREQNIMKLRRLFELQEVCTVKSASLRFGYRESTIRKWCRDGDIPLMDPGQKVNPVVPLTDKNQPSWLHFMKKKR